MLEGKKWSKGEYKTAEFKEYIEGGIIQKAKLGPLIRKKPDAILAQYNH